MWRKRGIVGEVQKERLVRVSVDERHGTVGEDISGVALDLDRYTILIESRGSIDGPVCVVVDTPIEETQKLIESMRPWAERVGRSEVPLADRSGDISCIVHQAGKCRLGRRQAAWSVATAHVLLESGTLRVSSRQQGDPGWRADGRGGVRVREHHAVSRKFVQAGRANVCGPVRAEVTVAHVVADDQDDVGAGLGRQWDRRAPRQCEPHDRDVNGTMHVLSVQRACLSQPGPGRAQSTTWPGRPRRRTAHGPTVRPWGRSRGPRPGSTVEHCRLLA